MTETQTFRLWPLMCNLTYFWYFNTKVGWSLFAIVYAVCGLHDFLKVFETFVWCFIWPLSGMEKLVIQYVEFKRSICSLFDFVFKLRIRRNIHFDYKLHIIVIFYHFLLLGSLRCQLLRYRLVIEINHILNENIKLFLYYNWK